jgi:murE/murF fusion protein
MLLKKLIKNIPKEKEDVVISGLSANSKEIKKNYIFFAIKGRKLNGEKFIDNAIDNGASVIICSKNCKIKKKGRNFLLIKKKDVRYYLSEIASKFYKLKPKNIIAVTGTNGKTSVADIFYQILRINNIPAATIGTLGVKYNGRIIKTNLTSPDTITLHKILQFLKRKKINNVMVETSSHGLDQKRLHHVNFNAAIFTNFTQDHLDYHKTMNSYLNAKLILFKKVLRKNSIVISDKEIKPFSIIKKISNQKNFKLIDISKEFVNIKNTFLFSGSDFKIKNLAMAIKAVKLSGFKNKMIYRTIKKIKDVDGRLELVKRFQNGIKVYIDYAHTPDALLKTLSSLKKDYGDKISLVFGCGGDRDQKKRPLMAKIAGNYCKKIYITDDNPRNENPKKIREELSKHIAKNKVQNIGNRKLAIKTAIQNATLKEVVLIAGKGHEEQQIYKNRILKISDKKIIQELKLKDKKVNKKNENYIQNRLILKKILGKIKYVNFDGLSIDTRSIKKDNLFLAIKGRKNDGNKYVYKALKKGAGCVATTTKFKKNNKKIIKINDSISFLNRFAKFKRENSSASIIAVTGSAGKTSLKNLIRDLLHNFGKTYSSPKSFNNHLGVPISLSNLSFEDNFGVFEVGMSKPGEIKNLTKLIRPHIGVITNIGEAHIENFENIYGIAKAKSEILEHIKPGGTAILNRDDKFFNYLFKKAKSYGLKVSTFGRHKQSDVQAKKITNKDHKTRIFININNQIIDLHIGDLNVHNVLAAISVLKELRINFLKIKNKFKNFPSLEGRGKKYSIFRYNKKFKLIDESYNANPLSVKNAINKLNLIKKDKFKKYLILGDMLELGSKSKKYHEDLSKVINNSDIDKVFIKGKKTLFTYKHLNKNKRGNILQNNEDIDISLSKMISNNDYVMIKGSNATGLNTFSKKMIKGI